MAFLGDPFGLDVTSGNLVLSTTLRARARDMDAQRDRAGMHRRGARLSGPDPRAEPVAPNGYDGTAAVAWKSWTVMMASASRGPTTGQPSDPGCVWKSRLGLHLEAAARR